MYSTYLGGTGPEPDAATAVAVDSFGQIHVTGTTGSTDFPLVNPLVETYGGGLGDPFVAQFSAAGVLLFSTYLGGSGGLRDQGTGIAVDAAGNAYVGGFTSSADFPTTPGAFQTTFGGGIDAFVAKIVFLNPVPALDSLFPSSVHAGGPDFTLTAHGSDFVPVSVLRWNGADRSTTFVSSTEVQALIPASDIANPGTADITVFNPEPGGGVSSTLTLIIDSGSNPPPTLAALSPPSANAGGPAFTLTLDGADFVFNSVVRWNGSDRATSFVSNTQLTAAIPASDIATAGSAEVTVFNPVPGGGLSNAVTFTINPAPDASFQGKVNDAQRNPVSGASVEARQGGVPQFSTTTTSDGRYDLDVVAGTYDLVASKSGFLDTTKRGLSISAGQTLTKIKFKLFRPSFFQGTVTQKGTGTPIAGALVEAVKNGVTVASTLTAADGTYSLQVTEGTYTLRASKTGYKTKNKPDQTIGDGATKTVNIALPLL